MEHDLYQLQRELDRCKSSIFLGRSAAFLGSVMSGLEFIWDTSIPTACTDGVRMMWNPDWFMQMNPEARKTVLRHEIDHVARLHMLRGEGRNGKVFNYACVAKGTKIAMANGLQKCIEHIKPGDGIVNVKNETSTVGVKINSGAKPIFEIVLESGRVLRCSADHKVLTDEGFKNANTLATGDSCLVDSRYGQSAQSIF